MSSAGQAVGGLVGGVIGFFVGGPTGAYYGAQAGMMIGGAIDPPKGPTINGPRLNDLSVQTSTYGAFIPRDYGTVVQTGNVFWLKGDALTEVKTTTTSGGKGGPQTTTNTFSYYATFAVGLCKGPIDGVRRIWIGSDLYYDAGSNDLSTIIASNQNASTFTLYLGTDTQNPDPLIQADKGAVNVPAYRGLAYIVFDNLPLEKYSNSLVAAQVKVEIVGFGSVTGWSVVSSIANVSSVTDSFLALPYSDNEAFYEWQLDAIATSPDLSSFSIYRIDYVTGTRVLSKAVTADVALGFYVFGSGGYFAKGKGDVNHAAVCGATTRSLSIIYPNGTVVPSIPPISVSTIIDLYALSGNTLAYPVGTGSLGVDQKLIIHDISTDAYRVIDFPAYVASTSSIAISNGRVFVNNASDIFVYELSTSTWIVNQTIESFIGVSLNGGAESWSGNADLPILYFTNNDIVYSVDTQTMAVAPLVTSLNSVSDGSGRRSFHAISDNLVMSRVLPYAIGSNDYTTMLQYGRVTSGSIELGSIAQSECLVSNLLTAGDIDVTDLTDIVRGYRVSQLGAIRSGLDPLRAAWPFDVRQHGYKIQFVRRGGASVVTIPASDLDARSAGQAPGVAITDVREMDLVLPCTVSVKYLDAAREYDINEQIESRANTDAVGHTAVDLPIVMTAAEAKQATVALLYLYWMERYDISFVLPPSYQHLEPGDVVEIDATNATYNLRLTTVTWLPDGRVECRAKYNSAALYTQVAVADEGQSTGATLSLAGPCVYQLLDIPLLRDDDDTAGFPVAMSGYLTSWPGGVLYRSDDSGQTWSDLTGVTSPGAVIGYATGTLTAHDGTVIDFTSTLAVKLYSGSLASVTQAQMFAGQNWFAYGAHGRWEIIAAQNCVLQVDGSYVLSDFLRGQKGTEWATGLHAVSDHIVLLDAAVLAFISVNASTIGATRGYRAITTGKALDSDTTHDFAYAGVNLECLSPVHFTGNINPSTNDWTLTWVRRGRTDSWRDYVDLPLGETTEAYEVEIYSSNTYTTLKRTLTGLTSATAAYTSAQQVTDFGSNQVRLYVKIYQISAAVGRGCALTASISWNGDSYWVDVVTLLHFDGPNGSTAISDETGKTWTPAGVVSVSNAQSKFGGTSGYLSAGYFFATTGSEYDFGTGDFTLECWIYPTSGIGAQRDILSKFTTYSSDVDFVLSIEGTGGKLSFVAGNAIPIDIQSDSAITLSAWTHIAVTRCGGITRMFVAGVQQAATHSGAVTIANNCTTLRIGGNQFASNFYVGYIDETRVTKGLARYIESFTPSTSAFPGY